MLYVYCKEEELSSPSLKLSIIHESFSCWTVSVLKRKIKCAALSPLLTSFSVPCFKSYLKENEYFSLLL